MGKKMLQRQFRLAVPQNGSPDSAPVLLFGRNTPQKVPVEKLFADLLKRRARDACAAVTECPPDTIPANLARLDDLREIIRFAVNHRLAGDAESRRSDVQLVHPATLADWLEVIHATREIHRCPAYTGATARELAEINRKLDVIAGLLATNEQAQAIFNPGEVEA